MSSNDAKLRAEHEAFENEVRRIARELWPECVIMVGGYHPSARPLDYIYDGSVFDVCVVGEGERPLVNVIERTVPPRSRMAFA